MKAAIHERYTPPGRIEIREVAKPEPGDQEVLISVYAATFNRTDCANVSARPWFMRFSTGWIKPKKPISGTDFAGVVEATGKQVKAFRPGDRVFGFDDGGLSSHAEYTTFAAEEAMAVMPDDLSFESAASSLEGAHYAYNFINKVDLKKGDKVMVNGATGAIGSAMVQLLRYFGAEVAATCRSEHAALVKSLGAVRTIDYTKQDFTKTDERFDYVFDSVGKSSFGRCKNLLKPEGVYISSELGPGWENLYLPWLTSLRRGKKVKFPLPVDRKRTVLLMKKIIEEGRFKAVIDRTFPLDQTADAYAYAASGKKVGNVVIRVAGDQLSSN